jgi:hypothetical protein
LGSSYERSTEAMDGVGQLAWALQASGHSRAGPKRRCRGGAPGHRASPAEQSTRYSGNCGRQPEGVAARCGSGKRQCGGRYRQESSECLGATQPPGSRPRVASRDVMGAMASPVPSHRFYTGLPVPKTRSFRPWDQSAQFRAHKIDLSALTGRTSQAWATSLATGATPCGRMQHPKCSSHSELHRPHATATAPTASAETSSDRTATSYGLDGSRAVDASSNLGSSRLRCQAAQPRL